MQNTVLPEIRKTIELNTSLENAWNTIATSQGIALWWMPNTFESIVGHDFLLHTGQFGDSPCKVTEIESLKRVSFQWGKDWTLTMELQPLENGYVEFTLIHSGWDAEKITEFGQPHTVIHNIMDGGWTSIVNKKLPEVIKNNK